MFFGSYSVGITGANTKDVGNGNFGLRRNQPYEMELTNHKDEFVRAEIFFESEQIRIVDLPPLRTVTIDGFVFKGDRITARDFLDVTKNVVSVRFVPMVEKQFNEDLAIVIHVRLNLLEDRAKHVTHMSNHIPAMAC